MTLNRPNMCQMENSSYKAYCQGIKKCSEWLSAINVIANYQIDKKRSLENTEILVLFVKLSFQK